MYFIINQSIDSMEKTESRDENKRALEPFGSQKNWNSPSFYLNFT